MNLGRFASLALGVCALAMSSLLAFSSTAVAHERREVGEYNFIVGWTGEPAFVNVANNVDLRVSRAGDGTPVTGLEQTLKVEVTSGAETTELDLRPRFNTPGAYDGRMFPTAVGEYSFRIFGTIEGMDVDEVFTSGPGTFGSIEAPEGFPNPLPLNQELDDSIKGLEQRVVTLESSGDSDGSNGTAVALGIAGVLMGGAGLVLGGLSFTRKRA